MSGIVVKKLYLILFITQIVTSAQENRTNKDLRSLLRNKSGTIQFVQNRKALIRGLMEIVADEKKETNIRVNAVRLLGEYRAVEASVVLLDHILEIRPYLFDSPVIAEMYPCVPALIRIGKPASKAVLKELHKPMKELRRRALVVVLAGVEGRQVGRFLLEQELARTRHPRERKNLQQALKAFLSVTANERTAEELKADEAKNKRQQ